MPHASVKRPIERTLLAFVTVIAASGFLLVYLGKAVTTKPILASDVNINQASTRELGALLGVSSTLASKLIDVRAHRAGGRFESVAEMHGIKALASVPMIWQPSRMYVRTRGESLQWIVRGALLFLAVFWIVHLIMSKVAPEADQWIVPMTALLAGIGLMMVYSTKDPYRDTFTFLNQIRGIVVFGFAAILVPFTPAFRQLRLHRYGFVYGIGAVLLMLLLMILGHGPGGVRIEVFGFQPIEFMKVLLVFFVACYLAERRISLGGSTSAQFHGGPAGCCPTRRPLFRCSELLFLAIKDLGPAVLLFGTFAAMLFLATGRKTCILRWQPACLSSRA